jgi:hypothetical protein
MACGLLRIVVGERRTAVVPRKRALRMARGGDAGGLRRRECRIKAVNSLSVTR